eukprot:EG_transcript_28005
MLAHLSGFDAPAVLPSFGDVALHETRERPAAVDLVALPALGDHFTPYAKSITVFELQACLSNQHGSQEWLYEVGQAEPEEGWSVTFRAVIKAFSVEKGRESLARHLEGCPEDRLARRLLARLDRWQPRVGVVLAERPDGLAEVGWGGAASPGSPPLSPVWFRLAASPSSASVFA